MSRSRDRVELLEGASVLLEEFYARDKCRSGRLVAFSCKEREGLGSE